MHLYPERMKSICCGSSCHPSAAHRSVWGVPADCREILLPLMTDQLKFHLEKEEELQACCQLLSDILEVLYRKDVVRTRDFIYWPADLAVLSVLQLGSTKSRFFSRARLEWHLSQNVIRHFCEYAQVYESFILSLIQFLNHIYDRHMGIWKQQSFCCSGRKFTCCSLSDALISTVSFTAFLFIAFSGWSYLFENS